MTTSRAARRVFWSARRRRPPTPRGTLAALLLVLIIAITATILARIPRQDDPIPTATDRAHVQDLLSVIPQVPHRVHVLGYDREFFGGWETQVTDQGWRCTTREVVLFATFGTPSPTSSAPSLPSSPSASTCPDASGSATDVYTREAFTPAEAQVDHIVPLAAAWDHGAHAWPRETRVAFANDTTRNLLAVSAEVNQAKSDGTPGEWLPPAGGPTPCAYIARYLLVISVYELSISISDAEAAHRACDL